ncbi:MAG: hypothetical protein JRG91_19885, partial [Deltaproteobacteria bacterium]|nr:hypothetical protein [Deltaproteobacteria bacterium]
MMKPLKRSVLAGLAMYLALACATTSGPARPTFMTTHVTLYDTGLAQIERQADIVGASELEIAVEVAHLDDLLASLVLATDKDVKVRGVKFPGIQNLGQALASSGLGNSMIDDSGSLAVPADLLGYARALIGTSVRLTDTHGKVFEGTILDAVIPDETQLNYTIPEGGQVDHPSPIVLMVTAGGALNWIPFEDIAQVAPTSQLEGASIKNFATALGKANGFAETTLVFETTADSMGKLAASYIRQIPMWRILYKLRVQDDKVMLEAWAVVHNDTPDDWNDVSMTLISGLPKSYVFSVASPRYIHRDVVEAPGQLGEMMPQLGAGTPDTLLYTWDMYREGGLGLMGYGAGGGGSGYGYGSGHGSIGTVGYGGGYGEMSSSLIQVGESAAEETMVAEVAEEISTYTAMNSVSLPSGTTSLVPLIKRELPGEAFTLLSPGQDPLTCVRIENGTGLVLQAGMASFYIDGKFRGQDEVDRLEPFDVRVLCYGGDMDVAFEGEYEVENKYTALEWKNKALWVHLLRTTTTDYTIENFAGQPRDLAIEITHIENGRVITPKELLTTDLETRHLYPFSIAARTEQKERTIVEEGLMSSVSLMVSRFDYFLDETPIPEKDKAVLKAARKFLVEKEKIEKQIQDKLDLIVKAETAIKWQNELLGKVPEMQGKSKGVDTILSQIMKAQK